MANKRYDQFTEEIPTTSRIILHADPSDGELRKCSILQSLGYYCAWGSLVQGGTNDPGVDAFFNSFPSGFSAARIGVGHYEIYGPTLITSGEANILMSLMTDDIANTFNYWMPADGTIALRSYYDTVLSDDVLNILKWQIKMIY